MQLGSATEADGTTAMWLKTNWAQADRILDPKGDITSVEFAACGRLWRGKGDD